jgi:hypothetical protein
MERTARQPGTLRRLATSLAFAGGVDVGGMDCPTLRKP